VAWRTWGDVGCFLEEGTRIAKGVEEGGPCLR
jgi:hypothetical protein